MTPPQIVFREVFVTPSWTGSAFFLDDMLFTLPNT